MTLLCVTVTNYLGEQTMYQDETLICEDCGSEFVFTAGEQEFYAEKGLTNKPKRCANCRKAKKQQHRGKKKMHDAVCAKCGKQTQVPLNHNNKKKRAAWLITKPLFF